MEWHPFAKLFPMLGDDELQSLADDIRENGLRTPIVIDAKERIVDGRNRAAACALAGVEPIYEPFVGSEADILKLVISLNVHRRHLNESQRAMVAAEVANIPKGGDRRSESFKGQTCTLKETGVTVDEAAEALSVSPRSVKTARKVKEKGVEELQEAVMSGDISVSKAAEISSLPESEQRAIVQKETSPKPPKERATKQEKSNVPATAKALIDGIESLHKIAAKDSMRISILELREVAKRIEQAARHYVGRFME